MHSTTTFKLGQYFPCIFLIILVVVVQLSILAHSHASTPGKASPFEFLKDLQGSRKGKIAPGIKELKSYLQRFGYLNYKYVGDKVVKYDNRFDDVLESAIKTYQLFYKLNATGVLDAETVSKMMIPRCGVPDITSLHGKNSADVLIQPEYAFFEGAPKWPPSKTQLTYAFAPDNCPEAAIGPVERAFEKWASATDNYFTFSASQSYTSADLKIGFYSRDHGDGSPFDGPGGVLAHSCRPEEGTLHFDGEEVWSFGEEPEPNVAHLQSVAIHEIGHVLGLDHSSDPNAAMQPSIGYGEARGLGEDDIQGIRALYGF